MATNELSPIQNFFRNKSILITGGTGFMGKVLVEKLLYSCSDLKHIFLLMREKRGKLPEQRLAEIFKLPVFQRIRDEKPNILKKVIPIIGDVGKDELDMSEEDCNHVCMETSIVFHCAATLRLDANLKQAINLNTLGVQRILNLCKKMNNLKVFLHISTAFCYNDHEVLYEDVYDCPHVPQDIIRCTEWMDDELLNKMTPDLIVPHPNTYTYTKRLAEIIVLNEFPNLPVAIIRPSIVTPSWAEPVKGWVDNLNGPVGILAGAGKGIIRSMMVDSDNLSEIIPVDIAINGLISIAWKIGTMTEKPTNIPVYNLTCVESKKMSWGAILIEGKKLHQKYPLSAGLWHPGGDFTKSKYVQRFNEIFYHWLPAYIVDFILFCVGQKPFLCRIQLRISHGLHLLQFFTMRRWNFKSHRFNAIYEELEPKDKRIFDMEMESIDPIEYMTRSALGGRQYCLKEPLSTLPKARFQLKMLYVLDRFCKTLFFIFLFWCFLTIFNLKDDFLELFHRAGFVRTKH